MKFHWITVDLWKQAFHTILRFPNILRVRFQKGLFGPSSTPTLFISCAGVLYNQNLSELNFSDFYEIVRSPDSSTVHQKHKKEIRNRDFRWTKIRIRWAKNRKNANVQDGQKGKCFTGEPAVVQDLAGRDFFQVAFKVSRRAIELETSSPIHARNKLSLLFFLNLIDKIEQIFENELE